MALLPLSRFCLSFPVNARGPLPSSMAFTGIAGCCACARAATALRREKRNELAPPHCPSQARESHRSGPNWEVGSGQVGALANVRFGSKAHAAHSGRFARWFFARLIASVIKRLASLASPQPADVTHLPPSRSL